MGGSSLDGGGTNGGEVEVVFASTVLDVAPAALASVVCVGAVEVTVAAVAAACGGALVIGCASGVGVGDAAVAVVAVGSDGAVDGFGVSAEVAEGVVAAVVVVVVTCSALDVGFAV